MNDHIKDSVYKFCVVPSDACIYNLFIVLTDSHVFLSDARICNFGRLLLAVQRHKRR